MFDRQLLSQLRDIHVPREIIWWPWLVGCLLLVLAALFVFFFRRYYLLSQPKRQALQLLMGYQQQQDSSQCCCANVSELLKRVALAYFPRKSVAGLQGNAWINFLNETATGVDFNRVREELLELPYRPETHHNVQPLLDMTRQWIKQRGRLCST